VLGNWIWKGKNRPSAAALERLAAAMLAFGFAAVAWMGYYDYRAFGNPLTPPYTVDRNTTQLPRIMCGSMHGRSRQYRYTEMRSFLSRRREMGFYNQIHSVKGFVPYTLEKVAICISLLRRFCAVSSVDYGAPHLSWIGASASLLCACLCWQAGMVIEIYLLPHYVAPFTAAFYAIGLQAMRHLRVWKPEGRPMGLALVRLTVAGGWDISWYGPQHFGTERAGIEARLSHLPGDQLVFVRYWGNHHIYDEWVYNRPNIDDSKVVWAWDMGYRENLELIHYYRDRTVWLVEPDAVPARITPYPMPEAASRK
jgi:hypothetical protein